MMDLTHHKQVKYDSSSLLLQHDQYRHRFNIPLEYQQISKEETIMDPNTVLERALLILNRGITVRKNILLRQENLASSSTSPKELHHQGTPSDILTLIHVFHAKYNQQASKDDDSLELDFSTLEALQQAEDYINSFVTTQRKDISRRMDEIHHRTDRMAGLKEKRALLEERVAMLKSDLVMESHLDAEVRHRKEMVPTLKRMMVQLLEAMPLLKEAWNAAYGLEEGIVCLHALQSLMNACHQDITSINIEEQVNSDFLVYLLKIGLVSADPIDINNVRLNCHVK
jgi:hypothetical protein